MKRISVVTRVGIVSIGVAFALTGCVGAAPVADDTEKEVGALPAAIRDSGTLRVGMSPNFPPMEFKDADGNNTGLDVDLMAAIAKNLGVKVEYVESPFDQLINSVSTDRVDVVMSGISDTVVRQETSDFVDYFKSEGRLYTLGATSGAYTEQSDMCGKTLAVSGKTDYFEQVKQLSTTICTDNGLPEITILPADSGAAARLQLDQGRADLAAQGAENLAYFEQTEPGRYQPVLDALPAKPFGIMVKKGNAELLDAVLGALEELVESGEYDAVLEDWDLAYGAMTPVINGVTS